MKNRKYLRSFLYALMLFVFVVLPFEVKADTPHELNLKMVKCDDSLYNGLASYDDYENCYYDYLDGALDTYVVNSGDEIDPGTTLMFILNYVPGSPQVITSINSRLLIDTAVWTPGEDTDGFIYFETESWPSRSNYTTDWNYNSESGVIGGSFVDSKNKPLTEETELVYFFMKLNDAASDTAHVEFSQEGGRQDVTDFDGVQYEVTTTDISFEVTGASLSHDASLGTLSITNSDTTYPISPTFTAGSTTNKTYSTVVPNDITYVDLNATPYHSGASLLGGGIGKKDLNVGNNTFTITVTSAYGNTEVYTIEVYRLSNDATLSAITLTNSISFGDVIADEYSYTTTIPFAIKDTTVSATTTHTNAYVDSGLGSWSLPNYDTLSNNKTLVVKAENCLSKYSSVLGNTCTSQNYNLTIYRLAPSDNSYLKSLSVDGIAVSGFNKTITEYDLGEVSADTTSLLLNGSVDDTGKATVTGLGTVNLEVGENEFTITVTAEDSSTRDYTVKVYRLSNEYNLSDITISSEPQATMTPDFNETFYGDYSYKYDATVTEITITATAKDKDKAQVLIYDAGVGTDGLTSTANTQTATFSIDTTDVIVMVTAEDGTVKPYTIKLERQKSTDSTLKSLSIDKGTLSPEFKAETRDYTATVDSDVTSVVVTALPNSDYGKIKEIKGNTDLQFGDNKIEAVVQAEDESTSSYFITVTKQQYDIATLDDILINGVSLEEFKSDNFEYTLEAVAFETTSINVDYVKTNSYSTVTGGGDISLSTGPNKIVLTVTAQNGVDTNDYIINVDRKKNYDNTIENLFVAGIEAVNTDVGIYEVTVPNSVDKLTPDDVVFTTSADATVNKTMTLDLLTTIVNDYQFTVTAEDGAVQLYSIKVTRTKSNDSSISRVTLTIGDDDSRYCLMENGTTCTIAVPVDTTEFSLDADISDVATISPVNGTSYTMPSTESTKNITLTVTAEDETTTEYTVIIERQKSANNNLSDLKVDGVTIKDFDPSTQTYELIVDGTTDKVTVSATVQDTGKAAIITDLSEPFNLEFDTRNKIEVKVQAEDQTTTPKTYTIYITRSHRTDATLSNLTINGIQISGFDSETYEYTLDDLPYNTHQLNIVATPNDEFATKTGDGLVRVDTGDNKIVITVTAHDTSVTQDYVINVARALNNDTSIKSITLASVEATYNSSTKNYEVTVPNNIEQANKSNLVVEVNDPVTELDTKASYSFVDTALVTTDTNEVNILVTAEDGTTKTYTLVVTREKSNVATLSSLTVTNGSFNPSFNANTFEYDVTVPVDTEDFDVAAITTEPHASITSGVGHYTMTESTMTVEVVVTSEDLSDTKTYTLNISRTKSSVNTLSSITVSEGTLSPDFDEETTSYTVNVGGSVESINVGATLTDDRATILSGLGDHDLEVGENTITITVQSESGAKQNYVIKVVRAKKENNNLATLTVDGVSVPGFDKDTIEYVLDDVAYSKTSIKIEATAEDEDATITGTGNKGLQTGENTFEVVVTAQNGTPKTYTIKITRAKNNNAKLSLLSVNGYVLVPTFDSDIYDYEVTVDSTKETLSPNEVTAVAEDTNATVVKQEQITLSTTTDNFYEVKVTAEDGETTETYTIKVIRPKSSDASLKAVNVTGATISPTFESGKYEYTLTVPYGYTDFSIEGIPNYSKTNVFGNGDYTIANSVVTLTTQAEDGTTLIYNFTVVEALSNDATLSGLSINGYPLDKTFQPTTLSYTIGNIPYGTTKLIVNATPNNANSTIEYYVDGVKQDSNTVNIPDSLGTKTITVKVTAPDGVTPKSYNISYTVVESNNAFLSMLKPSVGTIDFIKTTENYTLTVNNDVTSVNFDIETEDSNASISIDGVSSFTPYTVTVSDLPVGTKTLTILVTAQDGKTTKTYNVVIKRLEPVASNDAYLSSLSVNNYPLDKTFDMETFEYSIGQIPYALTELTINATPNHGGSTLSYLVNGTKQTSNVVSIPKVEGSGAITVQVLAEDGETVQNYKITYSKIASTNAYLESIVVSQGSLTFNKNTFAYKVEVDRTVTSIDITAKTEDDTATMQMNGTTYTSPHTLTLSPLSAGDTEVIIVVTAENGNVVTYKVTVRKEADPASTITSVEYGHTITNGYIKTVALATTGLEMKNQLDNENEYLEIWTADESRQVEDSEKLATGMIVKLIIDGEEKDRKLIVIKGDTNGDGEVDLFDAVEILNHYLERDFLTDSYLEAAYANDDANVDLFDAVRILNHYLERDLLH